MAEFDTSSYPKPQQQTNPLQALTQLAPVIEMMGNAQVGKASQAALNPETGELDRNKLAGVLAQTNAGAQKIIPTLQAHETLRNAGFASDQAGLDTFQKRMALTNAFMGSLASDPSVKNLNSIAARILDPAIDGPKYGLTLPVIMNALKQFRGPDGKPLPPDQIAAKARQMQTMTMHTMDQLNAQAPAYEAVDDGNTIQFVPRGSKAAPVAPPDNIPKTLSPSDEVTEKDGSKRKVGTQRPAPLGRPQALPGQRPQTGSNGFPPAETITGIKVEPATDPRTGQPLAAPSFSDRFSAAYNQPPAGPATSQRPGLQQAQEVSAVASANTGNAITTAGTEAPMSRAYIENLEQAVEGFTPGPGADYKRIGKAFLNANLPIPESWKKEGAILDPKSIADQESFNKTAYQLMQNQFQALGGTGTDAKLASTAHTSPNELMSKMGIKEVLALLKGQNDAIKVRAREWNKWKKANGPDSAGEFSEDFNTNFNPRVFMFQHIPAEDRSKQFRAMSPEEKAKFRADLEYAHEKGWIKASK